MLNEYKGIVDRLKRDHVNLEVLFNLKDRNSKAKTSNFTVRSEPKINQGASAEDAVTFEIPVNINTATFLDLTATELLTTNELYVDHHAGDLSESELSAELDAVAKRWAVIESKYAYYQQTPELYDMTTEVLAVAGGSLYSELFMGVNKMIEFGWEPEDVVIVVNKKFAMGLSEESYDVPDYSIKTGDASSMLSNKLGVKGVYSAPQNVVSGNYNNVALTPATTTDWRMYVKEYACFKTWDEQEVRYRKIEAVGYAQPVPQIIGTEYMGYGQFNDESTSTQSGIIKNQATGVALSSDTTDISEAVEKEKTPIVPAFLEAQTQAYQPKPSNQKNKNEINQQQGM